MHRAIAPQEALDAGETTALPAGLTLDVAAGMTSAALLQQLRTSENGLDEAEASRRLALTGANIRRGSEDGLIAGVLRRLSNPLNLMLLLLAGISAGIGDDLAAATIGCMVLLSVTLATAQERRSTRAAAALRAMVQTTVAARRPRGPHGEPHVEETRIEELVPGDVVELAAGDLVPADVRLLRAKDFFVNESALTGESLPVSKEADTMPGHAAGANVARMGTAVVTGSAVAVIVLTGEHTEFGGIRKAMESARERTAFEIDLDRYARMMLVLIMVFAPAVAIVNGTLHGGWLEAALFAMAVAVGLMPEMLPMLTTVNLGKGAIAMARKHVIVKRLDAIQNLGAMEVLCTDKTGTLTQDRVILKQHINLSGEDDERVLEYAVVNSHFQSGMRNLLDEAVLEHADVARRLGVDHGMRKRDEVPFDFDRRRMSVVVSRGDGEMLVCKGGVDEVLSVCAYAEVKGETIPMRSPAGEAARETATRLARQGFRVIAIAYRCGPATPAGYAYTIADEAALTLLGYIAFIDPPKDSAAAALAALHRSGVEVKLLTGDHPLVAANICALVGLDGDTPVIGSALDALDDDALGELALRHRIFAELSPSHKERLVRILRSRGKVVGLLGDGVNDGPALKAADVGISVDGGTEVAKDAADILLLEKDLTVLHDGVVEGRRVFANLTKYLRTASSSNVGNILSVSIASVVLPILPMAPIQILANNLLYDLSQTSLATDHVDAEALRMPRRWDMGRTGLYIACMGPVSTVFDLLTFGALRWVLGPDLVAAQAAFQTGWFVESLLSQTLFVHIARTTRIPLVDSRASWPVMATTAAVMAIGITLPFVPWGRALGFVPPPMVYWPLLAAILSGYLLAAYAARAWLDRRLGP